MKSYTYLPQFSADALSLGLIAGDWEDLQIEASAQRYERLGLERALLIALNIWDECGSLNGVRILDVGCNNGLFSRTLTMLGCRVTSIDNGVIDVQGLYQPMHEMENKRETPAFDLRQIDLLEYLKKENEVWDYVLLLSVAHHWETGYAMNGNSLYSNDEIRFIMESLWKRTEVAIYYECPCSEPGFELAAGIQFLHRHLKSANSITLLEKTIGPNGYLRDLFKIEGS